MTSSQTMDLKAMMALKTKMKAEPQEIMTKEGLEEMSLEEMGNLTLKVGSKHKGEKFSQIYEDDSYNNWVASHCDEDPKKSPGMNVYVQYLRRRLQAELGMTVQKEPRSGYRPSMPKTMQNKKGNTKEQEMEERQHQAMAKPVPPFEEDEVMTQWSKVEVIEGEMNDLTQRMGNMENMLGQILSHMQMSQQPVVKQE